ncbi:class 1 fructose-bisphosphatase [Salarchaeum japonicum]|uniref:class 1 fructose-bisphosphatase n=1 Tax=Salarchaeum japonicum TaxID=555573 RepID=UPI003C70DE67
MHEVFETVAAAAPDIRAGLPGRRRKTDDENASGETQLAADVWADELLEERLTALDSVGAYASEERDAVVDAGDGVSVAVDPLDGSSNLKSNNPMGTVVGVYDAALPAPGTELVAAGFVLYGPITTMVVADDGDVTEYVVEDGTPRDVGAVELPADPTVYGFGGRVPDWTDDFEAFVREVEDELKLRYGGAMIADVSQVLTYGGIFGYPGLRDRPEGKLRLLFEGAPIAYVVEAAGGASTDGDQSLLDVDCTEIHQRTPVFVGNDEYVGRVESL